MDDGTFYYGTLTYVMTNDDEREVVAQIIATEEYERQNGVVGIEFFGSPHVTHYYFGSHHNSRCKRLFHIKLTLTTGEVIFFSKWLFIGSLGG